MSKPGAAAAPACPPQAQIMQHAAAKMIARPLYLAAELGIADLLAGGAKTAAQLARATKTHEPSLFRLLRALASVGIFRQEGPRRFALTPAAECLLDKPGSMRAFVLFFDDEHHHRVWDHLLYSVKTGRPAVKKALGADIWAYYAKNPAKAALFNAAMTSIAHNTARSVVEGYDFSGLSTIVDAGGGHGALLSAILKRYPGLRGTLYDLPKVAAGARKALAAAGLADRAAAVGGDFFRSIPAADAVIMSHIIHDWDDAKAARILRSARAAVGRAGRVLVVETIVPEGDAFSPVKLLDIEMLLIPGGKERTESEYRALFAQAGLRLSRIVPTPAGHSVLEGIAA